MNRFEVVQGTTRYVDIAAGILSEAAVWRMCEMGFNDWPIPFPKDILEEAVAENTLHIGEIEGVPVATMILDQDDEGMWEDDIPPPNSALYAHKLAVRPDNHGNGYGRSMLFKGQSIAKSMNKSVLRLECNHLNGGLRHYYEELGFKYMGKFRASCSTCDCDCYTAAKYERPV